MVIANKYRKWIKDNPFPKGFCLGSTLQMKRAFPELKRIKGVYIEPNGKRNIHWWCVDKDNNIIDPTAFQFKSGGCYET